MVSNKWQMSGTVRNSKSSRTDRQTDTLVHIWKSGTNSSQLKQFHSCTKHPKMKQFYLFCKWPFNIVIDRFPFIIYQALFYSFSLKVCESPRMLCVTEDGVLSSPAKYRQSFVNITTKYRRHGELRENSLLVSSGGLF